MSPPLLEFQNVTVVRGGKIALDRFSLRIGTGENVAIVGPNGSGKSTLMKTITRELYPLAQDGSHIRVLGHERWNVFDLRMHLGVVDNDLLVRATRRLTGRDVVVSGFFGTIGTWPHQTVTPGMLAKADTVLERLGVAHLAERDVHGMSTGEVRRIVVGRALVHDAQALILDEPTNSLDLRAVQEFRSALRRLAQSGITVILVTHHLPDIIPEIERVILMKDGRLFRDGGKDQVLRTKVLADLFGTPVEVVRREEYYHLL